MKLADKNKILTYDIINSDFPLTYFYASDTKKDKFVWVTINELNPNKHDMKIYDIKINGTLNDDNETYTLELPLSSYINTHTHASSDYPARSANYPEFDFTTGEYRMNNSQSNYIEGIKDLTPSENQIYFYDSCTLTEDSDRSENAQFHTLTGFNAVKDGLFKGQQEVLDWSNASEFPSIDEWNLSWLHVKTKLL